MRFRFRDEQIRYWLRDQGSVLEIYTWKACRDVGIFQDVCCSTVVEWERGKSGEKVTNEIDVMAVRDATPVFISCKTCTGMRRKRLLSPQKAAAPSHGAVLKRWISASSHSAISAPAVLLNRSVH